ncbi:MAG: polynucleotide adenylyltransferase PcnB [Pseudomonadota bacterium]|nr:polynucleotide adenylyltransferase PcnB [Pseudomonadota bacterium]MEC9300541.1 polynucleotide adenylyltransferase PcnB [Pseudomonadota bacterium]
MSLKPSLTGLDQARIIERDEHPISRKQITPNALKVLYRFKEAGFHAFLVGGGVRDLMLGNKPKDFDIATNATPEEIKRLFKNARIIGRRFKIVHIRFGREIIEVTTFRAHHDPQNEIADDASRRQIRGLDSAHSSSGMILRDNVYGDIDQDALQRDFTVNALYYTVDHFRVLDFSTGMEDLDKKEIRIIGNPATRYREDPVRMLRAIRFSAKLGFSIEESTQRPFDQLGHLLNSVSRARLFDETLKLLAGGHAAVTFEKLRNFHLGPYLFAPTLEAMKQVELPWGKLIDLALENTDKRLTMGKSVTPAFLFAAILWPVLKLHLTQPVSPGMNRHQHFIQAANQTFLEQLNYTAIPRRVTSVSREIWELQYRLERKNKRSIEAAFSHPRFRAAYDFLLLREQAGENLGALGQWWTDFQNGDTNRKIQMITAVSRPSKRRRKRT